MKKNRVVAVGVVVLIVVGAIGIFSWSHRQSLVRTEGEEQPQSGLPRAASSVGEAAVGAERNLAGDEKTVASTSGKKEVSQQAAATNVELSRQLGLADFAQRLSTLQNQAAAVETRAKALHSLFARRANMSDEQVVELWRALRSIAQERAQDPRLIADAIWAMGDVGVLARLRGVMTEEEVAQEARFLLEMVRNKETDPIIQRVAVAALGDLRVMEAAPWLEQLLTTMPADVQPNVLRSACIALPKLTGTKAVAPLSQVLSTTENKDVFGTAAYALGNIGAPESLPTLVANRLRLGDNLSVDNAINNMSNNVLAILSRPSDPMITDAIAATRSLWREEHQKEYVPLLQQLVQNRTAPVAVRQAALHRLIDHAAHLPFEQEKAQLAAMLPSIQQQPEFQKETEYISMRLNAQVLTPNAVNSQ